MLNDQPRHRLTSGAATVIALLMLAATIGSAQAPSYTFTTFDVPGCVGTQANDINDSGVIVGYCFLNASFSSYRGFIRSANGTVQMVDYPGAVETVPFGINDLGDVVGMYTPPGGGGYGSYPPLRPFMYTHTGTFIDLPEYPGTSNRTFASDVNSAGQIVGGVINDDPFIGWMWDGSSFTEAGYDLRSINNAGLITGRNDLSGFIGVAGQYLTTTFAVPARYWTMPLRVNNIGDVVGFTCCDPQVPFIRTNDGVITEMPLPGVPAFTGINSDRTVVGYMFDDSGVLHGLIGTLPPPTPAAQIQNLITTISALSSNLQGQLDAKLNAALAALNAAKNNSAATAANQLQAFVNAVKADVQGGKLTCAQATGLVAAAQNVVAALGQSALTASLPCS